MTGDRLGGGLLWTGWSSDVVPTGLFLVFRCFLCAYACKVDCHLIWVVLICTALIGWVLREGQLSSVLISRKPRRHIQLKEVTKGVALGLNMAVFPHGQFGVSYT